MSALGQKQTPPLPSRRSYASYCVQVSPYLNTEFGRLANLLDTKDCTFLLSARKLRRNRATTVARPGYPERIELAGTKGSAVLETFQLTINRASGATETVGSAQSGGGGADPMAFDHGPHKAVISEMLNAIEQKREPSNTVRSGLHVQRLIEDILSDAAKRV